MTTSIGNVPFAVKGFTDMGMQSLSCQKYCNNVIDAGVAAEVLQYMTVVPPWIATNKEWLREWNWEKETLRLAV